MASVEGIVSEWVSLMIYPWFELLCARLAYLAIENFAQVLALVHLVFGMWIALLLIGLERLCDVLRRLGL